MSKGATTTVPDVGGVQGGKSPLEYFVEIISNRKVGLARNMALVFSNAFFTE